MGDCFSVSHELNQRYAVILGRIRNPYGNPSDCLELRRIKEKIAFSFFIPFLFFCLFFEEVHIEDIKDHIGFQPLN